MLKKILTGIVLGCICVPWGIFAYNPPPGGENMYSLVSPKLLSGGLSAVGGPFLDNSPDDMIANPALPGVAQRVMIDAAGTVLSSFGRGDAGTGGAFNAGLIFPSKWGVATGAVQGLFADFTSLPLGKTVTIRAGFAKDILDVFFLGASVDGAFGTGWALNLNLGLWHNVGTLGFMKDFRWGVSLTGIGKPLTNTSGGMYGDSAVLYPSFFTARVGVAATLVSLDAFKLALSLDVSAPAFQNAVIDTGLGIRLFNMVNISANWNVNVREIINGRHALVPSVGISVVFGITGKKDSFLDKQGWQKSEITPQVAWRQMYGDINALSAGVRLGLGMKDTEAPVITTWEEK